MKINLKSVTAVAVLLTFATPMIATAAIKTSQISDDRISVRYSASDLNTAAGKNDLETQIKRAARKICGPVTFSKVRSLTQIKANKTCFAETVTRAMERVPASGTTAG
jgi:UrcA family protein